MFKSIEFRNPRSYLVTVAHALPQMAQDENLFYSASAVVREDGFIIPVFPRRFGDRWHLTTSSGSPLITFDNNGNIM